MTLALAAALGLLVGVVLGAFGGGGAVLTVPVLVYLLGQGAQEATTGSLVAVGAAATIGVVGHARAGHVRWRTGALLGAAGLPAAYAGTLLNRELPEQVVLLAFAGVMLAAAAAMVRDVDLGVRPRSRVATVAVVGAVGAAVGFLSGLFGVGGGFVVVPALVLALALPMPQAVGTSLLVVAVNAGAALLPRLGQPSPDWDVLVPFATAAVVGSLVGQRGAGVVSGTGLTRAFAVVLVAVATYVGARSLLVVL